MNYYSQSAAFETIEDVASQSTSNNSGLLNWLLQVSKAFSGERALDEKL